MREKVENNIHKIHWSGYTCLPQLGSQRASFAQVLAQWQEHRLVWWDHGCPLLHQPRLLKERKGQLSAAMHNQNIHTIMHVLWWWNHQLQTSFRGRGSAALYEASSLMIVHNHNLWLDQLHMNMKRWSCTSSASWHWFTSHTFLWFIDCVSSWTTFEPHCRSNLTYKLDSGSLVSQGLSWRWQPSIEEAFLGSMNTS